MRTSSFFFLALIITACGSGSSASGGSNDASGDVNDTAIDVGDASDANVAEASDDAVENDTACPDVGSNPNVVTIAGGLASPNDLFVDANNAYFRTANAVMKVAKAGGTPTTLASGTAVGPMAIDATDAYVLIDGVVKAVSLTTGNARNVVATIAAPASWNFAIDDTYLYWARSTPAGGVYRVKKSGGSVEAVATNDNLEPSLVAADGTHVFWIDRFGGLERSNPDGSGASMIDDLAADSTPVLAIDSTNVYWGMNGYLAQVPKVGGAQVLLIPTYEGSGGAIATDGAFVYYLGDLDSCGTFFGGLSIRKLPVGGGASTFIAPSVVSDPVSMTVDDGYVYWASHGDGDANGAILRAPK